VPLARFPSVDCRLVDLLASVGGGVPAGRLQEKLLASLTSVRTLAQQAAAGTDTGKNLKKAIRALKGFEGRVRGAKGKVPRELRVALLAASRQLRIDLRTLRG